MSDNDAQVTFIDIQPIASQHELVVGMVVGGSDRASVWRAAEQALVDRHAIVRHNSRFLGRIQIEVDEPITPRDVADSFAGLASHLETLARSLKIASGAPIRVTFLPPRQGAPEARRSTTNPRGDSLAEGQHEPRCLAILGSAVYWQSDRSGQVHQVGIGGGPVEIVSGRIGRLSSLVAARSVLIGASGTSVCRIDPQTRQVATLAAWENEEEADYGSAEDAVIDGNWIYVASTAQLLRAPLTGGTFQPIECAARRLRRLAIHDRHLVFISGDDEVCSVPIAGGATRVIAEVRGVYGIASDGESIYWTDPYELAVRKLMPNGEIVTVYQGDFEPQQIVGVRCGVAWTASDTIMHADRDGIVTILARDLEWPRYLAMTEDLAVAALVPRNGDPGRIIRLAVPGA